MHAQFACAALPINALPGATRDEIMERICNFDFNHVIDHFGRYLSGLSRGQRRGHAAYFAPAGALPSSRADDQSGFGADIQRLWLGFKATTAAAFRHNRSRSPKIVHQWHHQWRGGRMIGTAHVGLGNRSAISHQPFFYRPADRQNGCLRRIDDGGELVNTKHAQIGNGERAAFIF